MEVVAIAIIVLGAIAGLVAFDLLALRFGADTRGSMRDDRPRSAWF